MKRIATILYLLLLLTAARGQQYENLVTGQVTFVASGNVYVKFRATKGISEGDTLYTANTRGLVPFLLVRNLSSTSCVCIPLAGAKPSVADPVTARLKPLTPDAQRADTIDTFKPLIPADTLNQKGTGKKVVKSSQHINGSISAYSYSDFSNTSADNSQRFRYNLTLNARNIGDSKFSVETYLSFRHKMGEWSAVKANIFDALKIYSLSLEYDPLPSLKIYAGRKINPRLSSIGASDGLQVEKTFGSFAVGAVAGARPDYMDYGFNPDLLQFGGYLGLNTKNKSKFTETSVAFMQQMNGSAIDRRFVYFQHSSSVITNLYFIGTFEADLYKLNIDTVNHTEKAVSGFDPTGLYLSLRYRFSDKLSVTASYDARKNIIYYETYKTFLDRILEDQMRQGYRLNMNYRISRDLTLGVQGGYRFLKSDPLPSKNVYGYLTYNSVPGVHVSMTLSATWLESSYMTGKIYGATMLKDLLQGRLQTSLGYKYADYSLPESDMTEIQHIGEAGLFWLMKSKVSFGVNYEGTYEKTNRYHRVYLQLRKRF